MRIDQKFNEMVSKGEKVYLSRDPDIKVYLENRKKKIKRENKELTPYMDNRHRCLTCGTRSKCHPITDFCFVCDTDNWELINKRL